MAETPASRELTIHVRRLPGAAGLPLPKRASAGAAGFDLCAAPDQPMLVLPGSWRAVPTGFAFEIPPGWEGQVRPRSGLARKHGITVLNSPGTVDSDYRGEIVILLINHGEDPYPIQRGERIAQIVFAPVAMNVAWVEVAELAPSDRGEAGFGSTGRA